jgi:NADH-quinone oxidoreductase subunit G
VAARLSNACSAWIDVNPVPGQPASASIYQLDGLVRRAASLQQTADAKGGA